MDRRPGEPSEEITVRRLSPADAPGVAACAHAVYGEGYARAEIYSPEEILRRNASGEWRSLVAVDAAGRVVAHSLVEPSPFGPIAEMGVGMVLAEHRRHGLLERMRDAVIDEARAMGLRGYYSEVGTANLAAQGLANRSPVHPCGITLWLWPSRSGRLSFVRSFRYVQDRPRGFIAFAPPRHAAILERLYAELRVPLTVVEDGAPAGRERLVVERHPEWQATFFTVPEIGPGTVAQLEAAHRAYRDDPGMEAAYLELPLGQPGAALVCARAEALGFFFAGVTPHAFPDGDALRLQHRKGGAQVSEPAIVHPFARELADYIGRMHRA